MSGELHARLLAYADKHKASASQVVARALAPLLGDPVEDYVAPSQLSINTTRIRRGLPPLPLTSPAPARPAVEPVPVVNRPDIDAAVAARANFAAGLSAAPAIQVSAELEDIVCTAAERVQQAPSTVLDTAINRMVSDLERFPDSWCRDCLQRVEGCECPSARKATP